MHKKHLYYVSKYICEKMTQISVQVSFILTSKYSFGGFLLLLLQEKRARKNLKTSEIHNLFFKEKVSNHFNW